MCCTDTATKSQNYQANSNMSGSDKANALMKEADETINKFAFFTSKEEKRVNARKLYIQAANIYKGNANFIQAATAFQRAADMSAENKDDLNLADDLGNVLSLHMKCDNFDAARNAAQKAVDLYTRQSKTSLAAKICQMFGEWRPSTGTFTEEQKQEQDSYLLKAMNFFRAEGSRATANEMRVKMAEKKALAGQYEAAAKEYEQIAKEFLDDQLMRATAMRQLFMALLCKLADLKPTKLMDGVDSLRRKFESYQDLDTQFSQYTQEHVLMTGLIDALESEDLDKYSDAQEKFSEICAVDQLKMRLLLTGKQALRQAIDGDAK